MNQILSRLSVGTVRLITDSEFESRRHAEGTGSCPTVRQSTFAGDLLTAHLSSVVRRVGSSQWLPVGRLTLITVLITVLGSGLPMRYMGIALV